MTQRQTEDTARNREVAALRRELAKAIKHSQRLSAARANLGPGTSRARVTSANAKWARAAEYRDSLRRRLEELTREGG